MAPTTISVSSVPDGFNVNPTFTNIKGSSVTLIWRAAGLTFAASDPLVWKNTGGAFRPAITRSTDGRTLTSDPYTNTGQGIWPYSLTVVDGTETITIDPEVNNEPPIGGGGGGDLPGGPRRP